MSGQTNQTGSMSLNLGDAAGAVATIAPIIMALLNNERRYELLGVSILVACVYGMYRMNSRRIDALEAETLLCNKGRNEDRLENEALRQSYDRKIGLLSSTILNLHADLTVFAGGRAVGQLEYDAVAGIARYTRAPLPVPPAEERRRPRARPAPKKTSPP